MRQLPQVSDAWHLEHTDLLANHEHRITRLESEPKNGATISPQPKHADTDPEPVGYFRPTLLVVAIGVVTGKITVDQAIRILSLWFGG